MLLECRSSNLSSTVLTIMWLLVLISLKTGWLELEKYCIRRIKLFLFLVYLYSCVLTLRFFFFVQFLFRFSVFVLLRARYQELKNKKLKEFLDQKKQKFTELSNLLTFLLLGFLRCVKLNRILHSNFNYLQEHGCYKSSAIYWKIILFHKTLN